ncbi:glycoside hydrolase family 16 protein [Streptomyces sp. NBC_00879]|uniref:glycoside hydrolase family 16 protein n=1 Tax=Streptomyces sp. NBC_00879 TaxID=2975855 RepID=UPI00386EA312|nr:glycoside hydrolase family 16 protein [Streptomyces sp. NBC_00879]
MTAGPARHAWQAVAAILLMLATACGGDNSAPEPPAAGTWHLVFHDDFNGSKLDTERWVTCYDWNKGGCTNRGNNEAQWYLPGQVSVGGGALSLNAERRSTRGSDGRTYPWTSGMISTGRDHWDGRPRRTFTYGYFEAAIRIPPEGGMFPAFWMMPASRYTPPELDIMEFIGTTQRAFMYVHWRDREGAEQRARGTYGPVDFPAGYHVFGLLWEADELTWYVDGIKRFRVTEADRIPHVAMEVLVNLAVGVPGPPPPSVDSARMRVDWVRVWQH